MRGKTEVDLKIDPPPDIVFEDDLSSGSLDKFPIYGKFGVPELWRYKASQVRIHQLEGRRYIERERSRFFPWLTGAMLTGFLERCKTQGQSAAIRAFRDWLRKERPHSQD